MIVNFLHQEMELILFLGETWVLNSKPQATKFERFSCLKTLLFVVLKVPWGN